MCSTLTCESEKLKMQLYTAYQNLVSSLCACQQSKQTKAHPLSFQTWQRGGDDNLHVTLTFNNHFADQMIINFDSSFFQYKCSPDKRGVVGGEPELQ